MGYETGLAESTNTGWAGSDTGHAYRLGRQRIQAFLTRKDAAHSFVLPPEEGESEDLLVQVSNIDVVRRHSEAGNGDIVGPSGGQTRLQTQMGAVDFARITLNNIKVHPVSDAFLTQQNQVLDLSTVAQATRRSDGPKWKDAMDGELESFYMLKVPPAAPRTPPTVTPRWALTPAVACHDTTF